MTGASADESVRQQVVAARVGVSVGFFMFGLAFAVWAVHIPIITARLVLDPGILGLALLNVGLGGVVSQPLTGWLVGRIGSRTATSILLPVFFIAFLAPIVAWNTPFFFVATFIIGAAGGCANVAINTQGSEIERARGRPTMSSFHGFFSLGALAGASLGSGVIAAGWHNGSGAAAVAAVLFVVSLIAVRFLLPSEPVAKPAEGSRSPRFALPAGAILGLAAMAFLANTIEGSVNDWSALYLSSIRGFSTAAAASGFAAFSFAMAVCRLAGGPVVARFGEKTIVRFGGALVAVGMGLVVLSPWGVLSPVGFAIVAIGAANTMPVMMGVASRTPGVAASAGVAATATGALLGFLIGPPVIGFVAHAFGLSIAIGMISLIGVVLVVGASLYRWPGGPAAAP